MNTHEGKLPHWKQKLVDSLGEVHPCSWDSFSMNDHYGYLPRYLSWKCFTSFKCFWVWLILVYGALKVGCILSWYQNVEFLVGSHMGSQEICCCNVASISLGRGSPINSDNWIVLMSSSIFYYCFQCITAMKCNDNFVVHFG